MEDNSHGFQEAESPLRPKIFNEQVSRNICVENVLRMTPVVLVYLAAGGLLLLLNLSYQVEQGDSFLLISRSVMPLALNPRASDNGTNGSKYSLYFVSRLGLCVSVHTYPGQCFEADALA